MDNVLTVPSRTRIAASLNERSPINDDILLESVDSAFCALTDFQQDYPITVEAGSEIDAALCDMNRLGVHALLVTQQEGDGEDQQVIGLITYYDIERKRPHRSTPTTVAARGEVRVGEVMTPSDELALVKYDSLHTLTASELYEMFQGTGLTHLLVVEFHDDGSALARGLVSRAALAKRLNRSRTV